jgi:hypothetical protein
LKFSQIFRYEFHLLHTWTLDAEPGIKAVDVTEPEDGFNWFPQKRSASFPVMGSRAPAIRRKSYRHVAEVDRRSVVVPTAELAAAEMASTEVGSASPPTISTAGGVVIEKASPPFGTGQGERHIWLAFCPHSN